jgi:cytochrome c biogenesis protein CcmG/thiol:disulfide interchange protein DsbE
MSRLKLFLPLLAFVALAGLLYRGLALDPTALPSARLGSALPNFNLTELHSNELLSPSQMPDGPYLLNVWATWCYSCRVEHAFLRDLSDRGVAIIGLNYKDDRAAALQWLADLGDPYGLTLFDPQGTLGLDLGVYGAPETYVIDQQGAVAYRHVGIVDEQVWERTLSRYWGEP